MVKLEDRMREYVLKELKHNNVWWSSRIECGRRAKGSLTRQSMVKLDDRMREDVLKELNMARYSEARWSNVGRHTKGAQTWQGMQKIYTSLRPSPRYAEDRHQFKSLTTRLYLIRKFQVNTYFIYLLICIFALLYIAQSRLLLHDECSAFKLHPFWTEDTIPAEVRTTRQIYEALKSQGILCGRVAMLECRHKFQW